LFESRRWSAEIVRPYFLAGQRRRNAVQYRERRFPRGGWVMLIGQHIGPFEIEKELGSGAMGTVYRAKFSKDGKTVPIALKVVSLGLLGNEGAMARFDREASILKQLRHPHIVRLMATGHYRKTPFIAMEFIDGEALDRVLARRGKLGWEEVAGYGKQLCAALQHAHDKGIIHRDLKPSNLMVAKDGTLKLTDFGIAKDTDVTALTGMNSTIGTAAYMSPEQCKGDKNLTPRSDVYSLGVVFYELLTGKKPFYADTTVDMFLKHVHERPPKVGKLAPDVPLKLEALILQMMEKDKEDRPTDAAWVARMLTEVEDDAFARKSAGLDAVQARRPRRGVDQPTEITDDDREAARILKGKKKRPKKKPPLPQRPWVKATGLGLGLAAIALGVFFAVKSPPADKLYAAVEAAPTADARKAAIERYLSAYGTQADERTGKVKAMYRGLLVAERETQLANRFARGGGFSRPEEKDDPEAYNAAWAAMEAEKAGRLRDAADQWAKVKNRFPDAADPPNALWTWVAEKRLKDLQAVDEAFKKVQAKVLSNRQYEVAARRDASSPESVALYAARLEEFGDKDKAAQQWDALATQTAKEPDHRVWYLLASRQKVAAPREAGEDAAKARLKLVREKVEAAEKRKAEAAGKPDNAADLFAVRSLCRDVYELYDDEQGKEIAELVKKARAISDEVPKG
jgi:serine/threonine-protein kinase